MRRSRAQWQKLFDEHQQSGLTQTAFCETRGLNVKYFSRRRAVLSQDIAAPFIKARMVSSVVTDSPTTFTLRYGGCQLELNTDVSVDWLTGLVKALS